MPDTGEHNVCAAHGDMMSKSTFFQLIALVAGILLVLTGLIASAFAGQFASEDRVAAIEKRQDLMDARLTTRLDRMEEKIDALLNRERK